MAENTAQQQPPIFVIVHGVGKQAYLETLKHFLIGMKLATENPTPLSRAVLDDAMQRDGSVVIHGLKASFAEINYADILHNHISFAEDDPRMWITILKDMLAQIHAVRGGKRKVSFEVVSDILDDILFAITLSRFFASRLQIDTNAFSTSATAFVQQVQLYIHRRQYRDDIGSRFLDQITKIADAPNNANRPIHIFAHSLGSVVSLRAMLEGTERKVLWLDRIESFSTFGSPLDLVMLLREDLFGGSYVDRKRPIAWVNYSLGNDPIASDLAVTRTHVARRCPGLFVADGLRRFILAPAARRMRTLTTGKASK